MMHPSDTGTPDHSHAIIVRDGPVWRLSCACGLRAETEDWREIATELTAHMGGVLPGYQLPTTDV